MTRTRKRPRHADVITQYPELDQWVAAFAASRFNLLMLIGAPGLQKSHRVRQALASHKVLWLEGRVTAFEMYRELFHHTDELVVIDDVDSLRTDRDSIGLLKCLCQTEAVKTVAWHSASLKLEEEKIPTSFKTTSRVCIIANDWQNLNASVAALADRGHPVFFEPSAQEVHQRVATWFQDQEILAFFARWLHLIPSPSMRQYVHAREIKEANMNHLDWKASLLKRWLPPRRALAALLKEDRSLSTEEARAQAFEQRGGGARATYFRHVASLRPPVELSPMLLPHPAAATQDPPGHEQLAV